MRKYGVGAFKFQVIESFDSKPEAYEAEMWWIEFLRSNIQGFGFNKDAGGPNAASMRPVSDETREKLRRHSTDNPRRYWLGRHHSDETRAKIAEANRRRGPQSEELVRKRIEHLRGRKRPEEVTAKIVATKMAKTVEQRRQSALKSWETRRMNGTQSGWTNERGPNVSARVTKSWVTRRLKEAERRKASGG